MKGLKEEIYLKEEDEKYPCWCDCPSWPRECSDFISADE